MATAENPWIKMALNNAWSNSTLYGALTDLSESEFTAERPGFFPSLSKTMNHLYVVDLYYLDALSSGGQGQLVYDRDDVSDAGRLGALQAEADMRFAAFCMNVSPEILTEERVTQRQQSGSKENVAALILHLVQHQIHHRGQAHVQLLHAGISPPQLDDFYLEYERAESAQAYWG